MSKPCEYVVTGALTKCTKGSETSLMKATPCRIRFRGLDACTICDKTPVINIGPFGTCKVSGEDCIAKIEITEFEDYKQGVQSGGCNFLLAKSKGICSEGGKISFITSGQDISLKRLLELLQKLEEAYPNWSREDILSSLLGLAGYGGGDFSKLIGVDPDRSINPRDNLTQNDIDELKNMLKHGYDKGIERGVITDGTGQKVALGHVLVGIMAGLNRDKKKDMRPFGIIPDIVGEDVDNLYASTLAGDLGKWSSRKNHGERVAPVGSRNSGASEAELIGDIDAMIMGESLDKKAADNIIRDAWKNKRSLSEIISLYNSKYASVRFENAINWLSLDYILDQIKRFAVMHTYAHYRSPVKGRIIGGLFAGLAGLFVGERLNGIKNELFGDTENDSDEAFEAYRNFIEDGSKEEKNGAESDFPNGLVMDGSC